MFATFDYPLADEEFVATVEAEVADQSRRLLGHPSTVVVCGSAEHEQQAAMFGVSPETGYAGELAALLRPVVEESGLDAVWVDSSPSGGDPVIRVDTGIAQYFGVGAYLRDLPDARHSRVKFAAECLAFSNLTDPVVDRRRTRRTTAPTGTSPTCASTTCGGGTAPRPRRRTPSGSPAR